MHRYRFIFILILFLFITSIRISARETEISTDTDKVDAVLLRIKTAASEITTLTGDFVQTKKIEILKNTPDSRGKFFYKKPDCLRWEIVEPVKMGFIVNGTRGKKWRKKDNRFRKFDVRREPAIGVISSQVFSWARGDFEKLKEDYEISVIRESPIEVRLVPLSPAEKKYIASIVLGFSVSDAYVERLEINETRGGSTGIVFSNIVTNQQLEEALF